eukprot:355461-Prymnesium_polylepis.1
MRRGGAMLMADRRGSASGGSGSNRVRAREGCRSAPLPPKRERRGSETMREVLNCTEFGGVRKLTAAPKVTKRRSMDMDNGSSGPRQSSRHDQGNW